MSEVSPSGENKYSGHEPLKLKTEEGDSKVKSPLK